MKTNFHKRSKNKKNLTILIGLAILIVFFIYLGFMQPIVSVLSTPFVYVGNLTGSLANKASLMFSSPQKILEQNKILQDRVDKLELELALKSNARVETEQDFILADVLIRPSQNIYGTLLVKKRGDREVRVGDAVLSKNGVYIGLVEEVNFSRISVRLTSQPGFSEEFSVERSGLPIRILGVGGGNMRAGLPQGSDIKEYDLIVDLKSGRVVAEVGEIEADEASAFMSVYLRMPINIFEITEVYIIGS